MTEKLYLMLNEYIDTLLSGLVVVSYTIEGYFIY